MLPPRRARRGTPPDRSAPSRGKSSSPVPATRTPRLLPRATARGTPAPNVPPARTSGPRSARTATAPRGPSDERPRPAPSRPQRPTGPPGSRQTRSPFRCRGRSRGRRSRGEPPEPNAQPDAPPRRDGDGSPTSPLLAPDRSRPPRRPPARTARAESPAHSSSLPWVIAGQVVSPAAAASSRATPRSIRSLDGRPRTASAVDRIDKANRSGTGSSSGSASVSASRASSAATKGGMPRVRPTPSRTGSSRADRLGRRPPRGLGS